MSRDTTVNVLLGLFLVLVFAIAVLLAILAVGFTFQYLDLAFRRFVPRLARPWDVEFYGILCLWSAISGVGHLRNQRWRKGFLSFATIAMTVSILFADVHSPLRRDAFFVWPWFLVILNSTDALLTRLEFILCGFVVIASIAVNTGLMGWGTVARVAADCIFVGTITLLVLYLRQSQRRAEGQEAPALTRA